MNDYALSPEDLARLAEALRNMPDTLDPNPPDELADAPTSWLCDQDGRWCPVYRDGRIGDPFSFIQMLAARGEEGESIIEALIVTDWVDSPLGENDLDDG
ncbi:hypothetical protein [Nocardia amamiensis]|uniref:hypothetical protein n=1 Tax=Nocardia amamiensis TaxID=404578 RepID=UPI0008302FC3|nr:hypothetical protein [Nocardia amamiensis]